MEGEERKRRGVTRREGQTHIFIRDDLHTLHVPYGLEDLPQHIVGHARLKAADVESALVRLRGGTAYEASGAASGVR